MKRGELSWFLFDDLRSACEGRTQDTTRGCKNSTTIALFSLSHRRPAMKHASMRARACMCTQIKERGGQI